MGRNGKSSLARGRPLAKHRAAITPCSLASGFGIGWSGSGKKKVREALWNDSSAYCVLLPGRRTSASSSSKSSEQPFLPTEDRKGYELELTEMRELVSHKEKEEI